MTEELETTTDQFENPLDDIGAKAARSAAIGLLVVVYIGGLVYAGVRSFSLFARTISPELMPLAALGIVTMELSALALPLALHYWLQPGMQKMAGYILYGVDLLFISFNAILDAAHYSGAILPDFMQGYAVFAMPALPAIAMIGAAILWTLDPSSRRADMIAAVQAATFAKLLREIGKAINLVDIGDSVRSSAEESARTITAQVLHTAPRRKQVASPARAMTAADESTDKPLALAQAPEAATLSLNTVAPNSPSIKRSGNGHKRTASADPKVVEE